MVTDELTDEQLEFMRVLLSRIRVFVLAESADNQRIYNELKQKFGSDN